MNKSNKDHPEGQTYKVQRTSPRFPPSAFPSLKSACLASGSEVKLINISKGGALLECRERLAPRTRVSLRFITSVGVIPLCGQILRSTVTHVDGGLLYRSAVAFEREFPLEAEYSPAETKSDVENLPQSQLSPRANPDAQVEPTFVSGQEKGEDDGLVTLTARVADGEVLGKLLRVNKW